MNRYPALPAEWENLMAFLEPVDPGRRPAIARMVFMEIDSCPRCEQTVRRCDARVRGDRGLAHLACTGGDPS